MKIVLRDLEKSISTSTTMTTVKTEDVDKHFIQLKMTWWV